MAPDPATTLFVDLEVFSPVRLNTKPEPSYGTHARAGRVTHFVHAFGDGEVQVSKDSAGVEAALRRATALVCHNMSYDLTCMRECTNTGSLADAVKELVMPDDSPVRPHCTLAMASLLNLPRGLGALVSLLGCGEKMEYDFSGTQTKGGNLFDSDDSLDEYAKNDVTIMRAAFHKMYKHIHPLSEWAVMCAHERINARGIKVDKPLLASSLEKQRHAANLLEKQFEKSYGFRPSQTEKLLTWIKRNGHPDLESVEKNVLAKLRDTTTRTRVKEIIDMRSKVNDGDLTKLVSVDRAVNGDHEGRLRNAYRYCGAHTGRFTSKGAQMHNMKRSASEVNQDEGAMARQVMVAAPGNKLFISDFSQIELRVNLWVCGYPDAVKTLNDGNDLYMEIARSIFGQDAGKEQRYLSKVAALAMQYGAHFKTVARNLGIPVKQAEVLYEGFHEKFPNMRKTVEEFRTAFLRAFNKGETVVVAGGKGTLRRRGKSMTMLLPDGRTVRYPHVSMQDQTAFFTHGQGRKTWVRSPWTLVQNFAQSYARSFLTDAMVRFSEHPLAQIVGHTHDELIAEVPESFNDLDELHRLMLPPNAPEGLLINAESGFGSSFASK